MSESGAAWIESEVGPHPVPLREGDPDRAVATDSETVQRRVMRRLTRTLPHGISEDRGELGDPPIVDAVAHRLRQRNDLDRQAAAEDRVAVAAEEVNGDRSRLTINPGTRERQATTVAGRVQHGAVRQRQARRSHPLDVDPLGAIAPDAAYGRAGVGTYIVDITDPSKPETVSFVGVPKGSHNQTVHPSGDYLYISTSSLTPNSGPTACSTSR